MTLKVQWGDEQSPAEQQQESQVQPHQATFHEGSSFVFHSEGGDAQHRAFAQVSAEDFKPQSGGILATAQSKHGGIVRELTPDTLVTHNGMTFELWQAERMGLVSRDATGRYSDGSSPPQSRTPEQLPQQQAEKSETQGMAPEPFPPSLESYIANLADGVAPIAINEVLMDAVFEAARTGTVNVNSETVASKTGMSPEKAAQFMQATLAAMSAQADAALQQLQVEPSQFVAWAMENRPQQFKHAMAQHVSARSLSAYRSLAKDFIRNTTPTASGLREAGYETRMDPSTGELMVKYKGMWMQAKAAARQRLI